MNFDEVWAFTSGVSHERVFSRNECYFYWGQLCTLKPGSVHLEIGLEFGRSSSVALQVAKANDLHYVGVDPWPTDFIRDAWLAMARSIGAGHCVIVGRSCDVGRAVPAVLGGALIDGAHEAEHLANDIALVLPRIAPGGFVLFHDYGRPELEHVAPQVDATMSGWEPLGVVDWLTGFRRPL